MYLYTYIIYHGILFNSAPFVYNYSSPPPGVGSNLPRSTSQSIPTERGEYACAGLIHQYITEWE